MGGGGLQLHLEPPTLCMGPPMCMSVSVIEKNKDSIIFIYRGSLEIIETFSNDSFGIKIGICIAH